MENKELPESIPYIAYEAALARQEKTAKEDKERLERINKRWFITCLVIFVLFVLTNGGWLLYESQFEDVVMTQSVSSDGTGDIAVNGVGTGELNYYGNESDANN